MHAHICPNTLLVAGLLETPFVDAHATHKRCTNSSNSFKFDVHSHVVPDFYREALIDNGFPVINGTVFTDGFPVPEWDIASHVAIMDTNGVNYSTLSVSAPGVSFLAGDADAAGALARKLNLAMFNYTQAYPTRLGAMCILPLPHVELAVAEIDVSWHTSRRDVKVLVVLTMAIVLSRHTWFRWSRAVHQCQRDLPGRQRAGPGL